MIIRLACVKLRIRLGNFKGVFARVSMARWPAIDFISTLFRQKLFVVSTPSGKIYVTGGHHSGLYSND